MANHNSLNTTFPFIVGPAGVYTTVQAAINAAHATTPTDSNHALVLVNDGTYPENLTLYPFVDLANFGGANAAGVTVTGNATFTDANDGDNISISGITFLTPGGGGDALTLTGVNVSNIYINNCLINGTTGTALVANNGNGQVNIFNTQVLGGPGHKTYDAPQGVLIFQSCILRTTDTASTISAGGFVVLQACNSFDFTVLTNGEITITNSIAQAVSPNHLLNVDGGSLAIVTNTDINCPSSDTYWITGSGAVSYGCLTFSNSASNVDPAVFSDTTPSAIQTLYLGVPLSPTYGGSGLSNPTAHGILVGEGSSAFSPKVLSSGQVLIGSTGADPVAAAINSGTGILVANGAGSITVSLSGTGPGTVTWNDVPGTTQTAAVNNGYIISNASATTVSIPATVAEGSVFGVAGKGAGGWVMQFNTGQTCHFGNSPTTSGGTLTSTNQWDSVQVLCVTANTTFSVISVQGVLTPA